MAVLMLMEWPGVTGELYDQVRASVRFDQDPPEGGLYHVAAVAEDHASLGQQLALLGFGFSLAIGISFVTRLQRLGWSLDASAAETWVLGRNMLLMLILWPISAAILRSLRRDDGIEDERDRTIATRASAHAYSVLAIALIALINWPLTWIGEVTGLASWLGKPTDMATILGYLLAPIAWIIGVPWQDATVVGSLIGQKIVINEFVAYLQLADIIQNGVDGVMLTDKGKLIATYALCGFANFSSIAIQIGGIGGLAPDRRADLARFGLRRSLAGKQQVGQPQGEAIHQNAGVRAGDVAKTVGEVKIFLDAAPVGRASLTVMRHPARHFAIQRLRRGQINDLQAGRDGLLLGQQALARTGAPKNQCFHARIVGESRPARQPL